MIGDICLLFAILIFIFYQTTESLLVRLNSEKQYNYFVHNNYQNSQKIRRIVDHKFIPIFSSSKYEIDYKRNSTTTNKISENSLISPLTVGKHAKNQYFRKIVSAFSIVTITNLIIKSEANAAKGAFEMDAEFYLKDLFNNNVNNDDNNKILNLKPIFRSPRKLNVVFAKEIIMIISNAISVISMLNPVARIDDIVNDKIDYYLKYFKKFVPIESDSYIDQYYFDMILYIYYLEASKLITESVNRVELRQLIGKKIMEYISDNNDRTNLKKYNSLHSMNKDNNEINIYFSQQLTILANGIKDILDVFKENGIISDFQFDAEDLIDESYAYSSFTDGLGISFQVTLLEPATILGFLLQSASNTFFHPEIVATTIANYARSLGYKIRYEDYLLDRYYRTENKDLQAQDVLLEFGLFSPNTNEKL